MLIAGQMGVSLKGAWKHARANALGMAFSMSSELSCWWVVKLERCAEAGWAPVQAELARQLAAMGCCATCEPGVLAATVRGLDPGKLVTWCRGGPAGVAAAIDRVMGFDD